MTITPGLIDLQVNGFAGVDFNSGALGPDDVDRALEAMLAHGVTACLPTLITATPDELATRLAALDAAVGQSRLGPLMCPGYHLEGPFLNPAPGYAGCHPAGAMTAADPALLERLQKLASRPILLVTLAPEVEGGIECVRTLASRGMLIAIGHSACDFAIARQAADAGAVLSTHLGNGLPQQLAKLDNAIFAQLAEDRLAASFIADGIHVPPGALKAMMRAKGERAILVTDAVSAAAAPPGIHDFAGMKVEGRADGSVRLPGTVGLAGSALTLDAAVRNLVAWNIASFDEAVDMASRRVAALLAPALGRYGLTLAEGEVEWSPELAILHARVGDHRYSAKTQ